MENQTLVKEICPTTTQGWVKEGAVLVDVREENEVKQLAFDVPNILHIPLSEFEERFTEIPKDKNVVMVCKSGGRSLRAAGFLVNHGYDKVVNMQHGIIRWAQKGFPTKGDTSSVLGNAQESSCCGSNTPKDASQSCCDSSSENNCC
ncbi:rhodanese-like domain-containing protein [Flavobacterium sp.]|uniref:rhodanese-like domain-containing protein n=1 Tax=Flavobacterium sp. TaxID=239 RepID=UPI0025BA85E8|nr:rhodanese-like domain-containing protein [Flavobacterium sp.]MBA4152890.1 rhodanese-like domain-containing protein [Flavobacterium sp.]